jgi:hypothetical protein
MRAQRVWVALPYAVLLALAAWFYRLAASITFDHQGDNLGPDFWPRVVLAATTVICVVQGVRILMFGRVADHPLIVEDDEEEDAGQRSNLLLAFGVVLTIAYGALVTTLGFLIATFLFMALFMYAGRYRAHLAIWLSSLAGTVLLVLLFQKVVYVSLPRGVPPFDHVADMLLSLF